MSDENFKTVTYTSTSGGVAVTGRAKLVGFGVSDANATASGTPDITTQGLIQLRDSDSTGGNILLTIPIASTQDYPTDEHTVFADEDAYILFENGIRVEEVVVTGKTHPLDSMNILLTYG